jgi:hypothetical protein
MKRQPRSSGLKLDSLCNHLCSLCLCGYRKVRYYNHRDTENTELHREEIELVHYQTLTQLRSVACAIRAIAGFNNEAEVAFVFLEH